MVSGHMQSFLMMTRSKKPSSCAESQSKYSDRFDDAVEELPSLASDEQKARMNMEFFPTQTWQAFYNKQARSGELGLFPCIVALGAASHATSRYVCALCPSHS